MHIDWWTLGLQAVNVLILIWLLARFFFRPVMDIVVKRQQQASRLLADAEKTRQEATDARADVDKARAKIETERETLIEEARKAAQAEKANLVKQATEQVAKLRRDAEAEMGRTRAAAEHAVIAHAGELSVDIAHRLLERFPPQVAFQAFLDTLSKEVRAQSEARENLASAATKARPIAVVTAAALSDEETHGVRAALKEAFGKDLPLTFRTDPAVIAGIELHGHNAIIRNSWRGDLERIREELSHDQQRHKA